MKSVLRVVLILMPILSMTAPAFAADWTVTVELGGQGRNPLPLTVRNYMMGCLPYGGEGAISQSRHHLTILRDHIVWRLLTTSLRIKLLTLF